MGPEKNQSPLKKQVINQKSWFWPAVYSTIAVAMIALLFLYNALSEDTKPLVVQDEQDEQVVVETNAQTETLKYPFDEKQLDGVTILQDFYDVSAEPEQQENALLVFQQTFTTSSGISIAINSEPFEVKAAMTGEVTDIKLDAFTGNVITLTHATGLQTRYHSVTDILVQKGDHVGQGEQLATTSQNDWNPQAGIHLHFEILQDGKAVNPHTLLAF